ncbi:hypothetical protein G5C60_22230 [Streptomyces sp. HC44]|uniref:Secreted protein n=1 Tax=Streptomyces scabichelini TaxID=2711217 RepID=A0A6G4V8C9_9ACTN|nr:hypothetical protein [Streptomyces scabichelini]
MFSEAWVLRGLAAGAAATAVVGAIVMRHWDVSAGKRVADLTRARASDEWRHEERIAELETDLDESRELRTKLEHRLREKRAELQGLRNEHAALLRRYATAETERASALEGRRLLAIEATTPARALPAPASAEAVTEDPVPAVAEVADSAPAARAAASVLYAKANAALDRLAAANAARLAEGAPWADAPTEDGSQDADGPSAVVDGATAGDSAVDAPLERESPKSGSTKGGSAADQAVESTSPKSGSTKGGSATDEPGQSNSTKGDPAKGDLAKGDLVKGGPVKGGSAGSAPVKGGAPKGAPPAGGPGKGGPTGGGPGKAVPAPGGSPNGGSRKKAPATGEAGQEGEATQGKSEAVGGHERTAAVTTPTPTQSGTPGQARTRTRADETAQPSAPADGPAPADAPAPTPSAAAPSIAAALKPAPKPVPPSGHFTVPTAVAVVPTSPARRPSVEGGFDFFGTQQEVSQAALEAVQNEDLADVVGQEALALHKAESEAQFKPADEESRGVGQQVIDLTAHDETEQIDVAELRSAVS